jgi:hypothetical protein
VADVFKKLDQELPNYIDQLKNRTNSEAKVVQTFTSFIQKVFNIEAKDLDFEVSVESSVKQVKGRMDTVFNNIILEFKKDLKNNRALDTAIEELEKYFQSLYEKNPKIKHIGIATDGLLFKVYQPIIENNQVSKLELINEINLDDTSTEIIFNWFDSYFFASEKIIPTSEHLKQSFGLNSVTYGVIRQELLKLFNNVKENTNIKIKYDNWSKFLEIVYGDKPNEINLFIAHTYLSTFVKLLVYLKLTNNNKFRTYDIPPILYGNIFSQLGIRNYVEDDFFTWIMFISIRKQSSKIFEPILQQLQVYDLDQMDEDILKELYQEMVKPDVRKQLGEFYTPDWLSEKMISEMLSKDPKKSVLDPSCGSGTFLFKTILFKIQKLRDLGFDDAKILDHVLDTVIGFDVHPLAALIAKTNYLLALRDVIDARNGAITLPVYLSDSIKIPEKKMEITNSITTFEFLTEISGKRFIFPENFADNLSKMDDVIEKMKEHGQELQEKIQKINESSYKIDLDEIKNNLKQSFENSLHNIEDQQEKDVMMENIQTLFELITMNSDTIWPYILRNMYKPIPITNKKVDIIIGNPPWLTMQGMKNETYQNFLKNKTFHFNLIGKKESHQFPHMELATIFYSLVIELYLKDKGELAFVMPKSILVSSHHLNFRKFENPKIKLQKIYDTENVEPLFKIPTCVIFCKKDENTTYPIDQLTISGKLIKKNSNLEEAKKFLTFTNSKFKPQHNVLKQSPYHEKFYQGATIVPRNLFFIVPDIDLDFGMNLQIPFVQSDKENNTKPPWSKITIHQEIDAKFLFTTLLGSDIIPFGIRRFRLIALPITLNNGKPKICNEFQDLQKLGYIKSSKYFEEVEHLWNQNKTQKQQNTSIYKWINYRNKITDQNLNKKFKVLYVASSTYLAANIVEQDKTLSYKINSKEIHSNGFIAESKTYYFETDARLEADYLCAVLNSKTIDNLIKPLQTLGLWGPRDIHKRPLTLPIPLFNAKNENHKKISELSKICQNKTTRYLIEINNKEVGRVRKEIREKLKDELTQIDDLVKKILIDEDVKIKELMEK